MKFFESRNVGFVGEVSFVDFVNTLFFLPVLFMCAYRLVRDILGGKLFAESFNCVLYDMKKCPLQNVLPLLHSP